MPFVRETAPFTTEKLESVGRSLCISILDISDKNEFSRINNTPFRTLKMMRYWTAAKISRIVPYKYVPAIRKICIRLENNDGSKLIEYFESKNIGKKKKESKNKGKKFVSQGFKKFKKAVK